MAIEHTTLIEELVQIDTPTLSNAIELLEVRNRISGFADLNMRCLTPELGVLCGSAVTAQAVTMFPEPVQRDTALRNYIRICEELEALPGPGVVVIQEVGPHPDFAVHCGDVMATLFQRFRGVGVVSDAGIRDLPELRELGFKAFARGLVASHANFEIVRVQVPVTVCGLMVEPGDLLHGDSNGLIKVPEEGREELSRLAAKVTERESGLQRFIRGSDSTPESIYERFTH